MIARDDDFFSLLCKASIENAFCGDFVRTWVGIIHTRICKVSTFHNVPFDPTSENTIIGWRSNVLWSYDKCMEHDFRINYVKLFQLLWIWFFYLQSLIFRWRHYQQSNVISHVAEITFRQHSIIGCVIYDFSHQV